MSKLKSLFSTPKRAVISSLCLVAVVAALCVSTVFLIGLVVENSSIGKTAAQEAAFIDAGIDPSSATVSRTKLTYNGKNFVYDVNFTIGDITYDYAVDAVSGNIVNKSNRPAQTQSTQQGLSPTPSVNNETQIGLETAKSIALTDAGLNAGDVTFTKAKLDSDDGIQYYDIEFYSSSVEYEYEIHAQTGAILERDIDPIGSNPIASPNPSQTPGNNLIGLDVAKSIALADAGLNAGDVTFTKAKLDRDDGIQYYDIEFYSSSAEYEYEIHAQTGAILERDIDPIGSNPTAAPNPSQTPGNNLIGLDAAKSIALTDAGLNAGDVTFTTAKLDRDDGIQYYDIEFYSGSAEYEYEIHAQTGAILERDVEPFPTPRPTDGGAYIGVDQAKLIAVRHAGFEVNEVTFIKAKLENDDGHMVYEIEFYKNGIEYEYTINAYTGEILDYEWDD